MNDDEQIDETRREKENMDEPQEEFISDAPPSRSREENDETGKQQKEPPKQG